MYFCLLKLVLASCVGNLLIVLSVSTFSCVVCEHNGQLFTQKTEKYKMEESFESGKFKLPLNLAG